MKVESPFIFSDEAAQFLGVSRSTLSRLVHSGELRSRVHGDRPCWLIEELMEYSNSTRTRAIKRDKSSNRNNKFRDAQLRVLGRSFKTEDHDSHPPFERTGNGNC